MYTRRKMYTERRSREKLRVMRSRELSGCSQLAAVQSGVMVVAPFTASPGFALLDNHASLRLVADAVHEDDALALALACTPLRDALLQLLADVWEVGDHLLQVVVPEHLRQVCEAECGD